MQFHSFIFLIISYLCTFLRYRFFYEYNFFAFLAPNFDFSAFRDGHGSLEIDLYVYLYLIDFQRQSLQSDVR